MVKTTIKETTEKYDQNGKLIEKIIREEITEDDTIYPIINEINNEYKASTIYDGHDSISTKLL